MSCRICCERTDLSTAERSTWWRTPTPGWPLRRCHPSEAPSEMGKENVMENGKKPFSITFFAGKRLFLKPAVMALDIGALNPRRHACHLPGSGTRSVLSAGGDLSETWQYYTPELLISCSIFLKFMRHARKIYLNYCGMNCEWHAASSDFTALLHKNRKDIRGAGECIIIHTRRRSFLPEIFYRKFRRAYFIFHRIVV